MKIIAIVVTYKGEKWIDKCLDSLLYSTVPVQVLVIDNASGDNTVNLIRQKYPTVEIIETSANLGFGKANNIGLKKALEQGADYVFLLNQDAWVEKDCIEKLVGVADVNKGYGIISPFHYNYDGSAPEKYFNDWVIGHYTAGYTNDLHLKQVKRLYPSAFIHAAAWLLPVSTIKKVGGFDPLFFHTGEDNDYVQRLFVKHLKIGFVPAALVYHEGTNEGLVNPAENITFKINQALLKFKNPQASLKGALLLFFKSSFRSMGAAFVSAKFADLKIEGKVFWLNLRRLKKISASKKLQISDGAYLKPFQQTIA